jgi:peptide/nickel transport system ATP-binding protein
VTDQLQSGPAGEPAQADGAHLLEVHGLDVDYHLRRSTVPALRGIDLTLDRNEIVGVVGESGSGKSTLAAALMRLLPANGRISGGRIVFEDRELLDLDAEAMRQLRGAGIAMVFQDPLTSLNPTFTVAAQMLNAQRAHGIGGNDGQRRREAIAMLDRVGIPDADERVDAYPHEFSGGMRQRMMIATTLLLRPRLLIADEATSALDVTTQAQILALLCDLCREDDTSIIVISHDLGVIAQVCQRVLVLKGGLPIESGRVDDVLTDPQEPYTQQLLAAVPSRHHRNERLQAPEDEEEVAAADAGSRARSTATRVAPPEGHGPLLEVDRLHVYFPEKRGLVDKLARRPPAVVHAVDGVDLELTSGEAVGLVGESGSGKTTLGKALLGLVPITAGDAVFAGHHLQGRSSRDWRPLRSRAQMIFQEPTGSLSPRQRVGQLLTEPYRINDTPAEERYDVDELLTMVRLSPAQATKYPHELSGGQARRVGIARALSVHPDLIIADEPTAGLDVSSAASVLNLIQDLRRDLGLTILMITHDLNLVGYVTDRIAVMYLGKIVEIGTADQIFDHPGHPYTQALLDAIPEPVPGGTELRTAIAGEVPSARTPPSGCRFRTRCPFADDRCVEEVPPLYPGGEQHGIACHFWERIADGEKPRTGPRQDPQVASAQPGAGN